jgi:uncharacterized protein (DUF2062 family)
MFKRRATRSPFSHIFGFLWPQMGWRRAVSYYWHRLKRIPGTPESIAMGFACGAAASMMPFMGFHFILSAVLAWLFRGSIIASAIGTAVGNPWTFPFIWVGTYEIGQFFIGTDYVVEGDAPFRRMFMGLFESAQTFNWDLFVERVLPTFIPMLAGSIPASLAMGVASYFVVLRPIRAVHKLRQDRKDNTSEYADNSG